MATGIEELVEMLFTMIDEAKNAPLSSEKCVIERDKALDILDDIKAQFPVELAEARKILNARNEYVAAAKREADEIRKRAEIEAGQMVSEDRVMNQARQKANELVAQAEAKAKEVRRSANEYCEDVLRRTEEALADAHSEMRQVRSRFRSVRRMPLPRTNRVCAPSRVKILGSKWSGWRWLAKTARGLSAGRGGSSPFHQSNSSPTPSSSTRKPLWLR